MAKTRRLCLELLAGAALLQTDFPAAAGAVNPAAAAMPLHCTLKVQARVKRGEPVLLEWQFSNGGAQPLQFLSWGTPFEGGWFAPYVQVTRNGQPLDYGGPMVKRGEPAAQAYRSLAPGVVLTATVALNTAFDLSAAGHYRVQPQIVLHDLMAGTEPAPRLRARHATAALACEAVDFEIDR